MPLPGAGAQRIQPVHIDDVVGGLLHCIGAESLRGPVNLTAPNPVTNLRLSKALGRALSRPAVVPVPAVALRIAYGEMSSVVTTGHRVVPDRLLEDGYRFHHGDVEAALRDVLRRW